MVKEDHRAGGFAPSESIPATFGHDHDRLLASLTSLLETLETERGRWLAVKDRFDSFAAGLRRHIDAEDRFIFPRFEQRTGLANEGPTVMLRREHAEIQNRLAAIDVCLARGRDIGALRSQLRALRALFEDHRRREETGLYATSHQMMTAQERQEAIDALQWRQGRDAQEHA